MTRHVEIASDMLSKIVGNGELKALAECMKKHCGKEGAAFHGWYVDATKLLKDLQKKKSIAPLEFEAFMERLVRVLKDASWEKGALDCMLVSCREPFVALTSNEAAASHSVLSALIVKIQANEHKESLLIKDREFALYIMKLVSKQVEAALGKIKSWCERKELHDLAACVKRSCKDSTLSDYVRSVKAELKAAMKLAAKMDAMYASDKQLPTLKAVNGLLMKAIDLLVQMLKTSNSYMATLSNKKFVTCMVSKCEEPYAAYLLVMLKETSKHI